MNSQNSNKDLEKLLKITRNIFKEGKPQPRNNRIKTTIEGQQVTTDVLTVLKTFSLLIIPVPSEMQDMDMQYETTKMVIARVWANLSLQGYVLPTNQTFIKLIYLGIDGGSEIPFLALYSSVFNESYNHYEMYMNSSPMASSDQCKLFLSCLASTKYLILSRHKKTHFHF